MRIGIDCRTMLGVDEQQFAGTSHYTYHLVKNLLELDTKNEYILFFHRRPSRSPMFSFLFNAKNVRVIVFPWYFLKPYVSFLYAHVFIPFFLKKYKLDIYHNPGPFIPLLYRGKSVMTVHDMTSFTHPQWFDQSWIRRIISKYIVFPWSVQKATSIICVSDITKRDLCERYDVQEKSVVVHLGVEAKQILSHQKEPYILFVGTIEPRKNLIHLMRAYRAYVKKVSRPYRFLIAGKKGWKYQEIEKELEKGDVQYLGYVGQTKKDILLRHASLFVFPSLYEGFGLPVLEAMSHGAPVVTSKRGALPEVAQDAAYYVDPENEEEMGEVLHWLLHTPAGIRMREELMRKGFARISAFSWEKTAQETLGVYEKMV